MAFRKLLTGWALAGTACLLPVAHAASLSDQARTQAVEQAPATAANAHRASPVATGPLGSANVPRLALDDTWMPAVRSDMNETVIRIPVDAGGTVTLETTIYRPDGPGPFPMVIFNHGKIPGDPRNQ